MMRKYVLPFLSILLLSACTTNDRSKEEILNENVDSTVAIAFSNPPLESNTTFEGNVLENDSFRLSIENAELIESPAEGKSGLFLTFLLKNKSETEEIVPIETLEWIQVEQENETSRIILDNRYHFLDAFGDEMYNNMVEKDNATRDYLLPGKEIEFVTAYNLDNTTHPVKLVGLNHVTNKEIGNYLIKLEGKETAPVIETDNISEIIEEDFEPETEEITEYSYEEDTPTDDEKNATFERAVEFLAANGFFLGGADDFLYSEPNTSGLSQSLFLATQSNDEDGFLSSQVYPIFEEASLYFTDIEIWLHDLNREVILIAENGVITYSIIN